MVLLHLFLCGQESQSVIMIGGPGRARAPCVSQTGTLWYGWLCRRGSSQVTSTTAGSPGGSRSPRAGQPPRNLQGLEWLPTPTHLHTGRMLSTLNLSFSAKQAEIAVISFCILEGLFTVLRLKYHGHNCCGLCRYLHLPTGGWCISPSLSQTEVVNACPSKARACSSLLAGPANRACPAQSLTGRKH